MLSPAESVSVSGVIASQIRAYRMRKGWSVRQLAEVCEKLGAAQLTAASLANIERGQDPNAKRSSRRVLADELFVLARALDVSPNMLVFPTGEESSSFGVPESPHRCGSRGNTMNAYADPTLCVFASMRRLRKQRGWSAEQLARRLNDIGFPASRSTIANMESGRVQTAPVSLLYALSHIFGIGADTLAGGLCPTCNSAPPPGFQCRACGAEGEDPES